MPGLGSNTCVFSGIKKKYLYWFLILKGQVLYLYLKCFAEQYFEIQMQILAQQFDRSRFMWQVVLDELSDTLEVGKGVK